MSSSHPKEDALKQQHKSAAARFLLSLKISSSTVIPPGPLPWSPALSEASPVYQGPIANLIEEQDATVGSFAFSWIPAFSGADEGTLFVSEKFNGDQVSWNRTAIDEY